jgi:hypothetical protein
VRKTCGIAQLRGSGYLLAFMAVPRTAFLRCRAVLRMCRAVCAWRLFGSAIGSGCGSGAMRLAPQLRFHAHLVVSFFAVYTHLPRAEMVYCHALDVYMRLRRHCLRCLLRACLQPGVSPLWSQYFTLCVVNLLPTPPLHICSALPALQAAHALPPVELTLLYSRDGGFMRNDAHTLHRMPAYRSRFGWRTTALLFGIPFAVLCQTHAASHDSACSVTAAAAFCSAGRALWHLRAGELSPAFTFARSAPHSATTRAASLFSGFRPQHRIHHIAVLAGTTRCPVWMGSLAGRRGSAV